MIDKAFSVSPPQVDLKELKNKKTVSENIAGPKEFESYLKSSGGMKKKTKDENEKATDGFSKKNPNDKLAVKKPKAEKADGDEEKTEIKKKKNIDGAEAALNLMVSRENEIKVPDSDKDLVLASENLEITNTKQNTQVSDQAVELNLPTEDLQIQPELSLETVIEPQAEASLQPQGEVSMQVPPEMAEMMKELQASVTASPENELKSVQPDLADQVQAEMVLKPQDETLISETQPETEFQTQFEGQVKSSLKQDQFNRHLEGLKGQHVEESVQQPMTAQVVNPETMTAATIEPEQMIAAEQMMPLENKKNEVKTEVRATEAPLAETLKEQMIPTAALAKKETDAQDSNQEKSEKDFSPKDHTEAVKADGSEVKAFHVGHESFKADLGMSSSGSALRAEGPTQAQTQAKMDNLEGMQNVFNQAQYLVKKGGGEVSVEMTPDGLGKVHLRMMVENGNVQLELSTQNQSTKKLIEEHISDLKSSLAAHQMNVEHVKINTVVETNTDNRPSAFDTRGGAEQQQAGQFTQSGSSQQSFSEGRRSYQPERLEGMTQVNLGNLIKATAKRVYEDHKANGLNRVA